jgi:acyl-CoA synthetase (AMP-forming)/AMP-acid ligase II
MDTRTLPAAFEQAADWRPDEPAFLQAGDPERRYTYREAYEAASRFGNALRGAGVEPGDRVAFLSETTVEHAVAYFGSQLAGAIPVTLHVREAVQTIQAMLERVEPAALVFQPRYADTVEAVRDAFGSLSAVVCFDETDSETGSESRVPEGGRPYSDFVDDSATIPPDLSVAPDDVAFINFSSGTTGTPKGIVHTHAEAIEGAHLGQYKLGVDAGGTYLIQATPSFIGWSMLLFPTLNTGATGVFLENWSAESVLEATERHALDLLLLVSTQWRRILEAGVDNCDTSSISHAIYTGEPIDTTLLEQIREHVSEDVYTVYSSTEALNAGTVLFPDQVSPATLESVGRPAPNTELRLVEPGSKDPEATVPEGDIGEVILRGPPVAERVWRPRPETEGLFHEDGWWFSGDLGCVGPEGNLVLKGRADNMIKTGGINVYAEGVERELERHAAVEEALVVGVTDEKWGEAVKAYVVSTEANLTPEAIDEWCRSNEALANYQRPRHYEFVESLPRTASGKLDRDSLR